MQHPNRTHSRVIVTFGGVGKRKTEKPTEEDRGNFCECACVRHRERDSHLKRERYLHRRIVTDKDRNRREET